MYHSTRHYVKVISYFLVLLCIIGFSFSGVTWALDNENGAVARKKLWLGDFDNGLIWIVSLDLENKGNNKVKVLSKFQAPALNSGRPFPTGIALLMGKLYVNNFNFNFDCQSGNELFKINKLTGKILGVSVIPDACAIDDMAAIPEAGLLIGIDSRSNPERLILLKPTPDSTDNYLISFISINGGVPGNNVRGLAYLNGRIYIEEDDTQSIYIYQLNLSKMTVMLKGSINIGIYSPSTPCFPFGEPCFPHPIPSYPALAGYGKNLIAYDVLGHQLLVIRSEPESNPERAIVDKISLVDACRGGLCIGRLASLTVKNFLDAYDDEPDIDEGSN